MDEIIPTFTMTWLEGKLDELFETAVECAGDPGVASDTVTAYANALAHFGYEAMTVDQIEGAIYDKSRDLVDA